MNEWSRQSISEIELVVDPPRVYNPYRYGTSEYWKYLERELQREADEFMEFIRDHRSRDSVGIYTRKVYVTICKFCGHEYSVGSDIFDVTPDCCEEAMKAAGVIE